MGYILGINDGHCATACLLKDGAIVGCVSEERFNRIKNWAGFPTASVRWLLERAGINIGQVDAVVLNYKFTGILNIGDVQPSLPGGQVYRRLASLYWRFSSLLNSAEYRLRGLRPFSKWTMTVGEKVRAALLAKERIRPILELGVLPDRIVLCEHHDAHIYSILGWDDLHDETVIITVDGEGDLVSATVNVYRGGKFERICTTSRFDSLGLLYSAVTRYMGMKPLEHEYKIMGLAPYCSDYNMQKTVPVFENLITLDSSNGLAFRSRYRSDLFPLYLERNLRGHRFDAVAGSLQKHTEALLTALVSNAIHVTGVRRVGLAGGVFMNVKANMLVAQMPEVEDLFIFPSCGDESTAIGSAYWAYFHTQGHRPAPLLNLYLGPAYDDEVSQFMEVQKRDEKYQVKKPDCIEERVADLLAQGKVVARFKGRMEWGARALGNRSILAHPSNPDIIRVINEQVKNRDFWMPFAPSILEERAHDYIVNSKNIPAPYMILAFESTELARRELRAAMHPYDYTLRPQIVKQEWNPSYHRLLKAFEERTGIGGILNTSFNLHGEPIVCTPADAFRVFDCSGLEYLAIGEYLIRKA